MSFTIPHLSSKDIRNEKESSLVRNSVVMAFYLLFSVSCFFTVHEHSLKSQNVMKNGGGFEPFLFYTCYIGNSVYYKSRGGEWAVRFAG